MDVQPERQIVSSWCAYLVCGKSHNLARVAGVHYVLGVGDVAAIDANIVSEAAFCPLDSGVGVEQEIRTLRVFGSISNVEESLELCLKRRVEVQNLAVGEFVFPIETHIKHIFGHQGEFVAGGGLHVAVHIPVPESAAGV